ncbi:MAG: phosphatidate cytidylyltransferase [Candidatus Saccharimonadales bacterium]
MMVLLLEGFLLVALHIKKEVSPVNTITEVAVRVKASKSAMAVLMLAVVLPVVGLSAIGTAVLIVALMIGVLIEVVQARKKAKSFKARLYLKLLLFQMIIGLLSMYYIRRIPDGFQILVVVAASVFINDWLAQATGQALKNRGVTTHQLVPKISPAKTVEGLIGGLLFGWAGGYIALISLSGTMTISHPLLWLVVLFGPPLAVIGDLAESATKRSLQIKDVGTVLGKHGGLMDRIDAVTAAMIGTLLILYLGKVYV